MIKKYLNIKLIFLAVLSALIHSIAITNFSIPANLYPAGFSGISRLSTDILSDFLKINVSYSLIYFGLNIIVCLFVYKRIGKIFTIYSAIQFSLVSVFTLFMPRIFVVQEPILYCVFGGIINGVGVGLALASNFSTGGLDFISVYFSNKYKKSLWNYSFLLNVVILAIAGFIYGWDRAMYSIIYQFCSTEIVKLLHQRYTYRTLTIITTKPNEVSDEILKNVRHGITEIKAHGHFSNKDNTMIYTVVNTFQYHNVVKIILSVDPNAFINVQKTQEIYGNYYQKPLD